jgi:RNA polymerase sigma-70 factor (ECF subfamily)
MATDDRNEDLFLLLEKSQEGDERAMESIYERYKKSLFNLAYRYTYNPVAAEDLLQDIFVKIFSHIGDVRTQETFVAWMYRVAVNTCYSYLRSRKSESHKSIALSEIEGKKEEAVYDGHEESLSKPLDEAIQTLPERLRAVFLLHDVEGYKHEEIARTLGFTVGTSKSQLFKARLRIRDYLKRRKGFRGGRP